MTPMIWFFWMNQKHTRKQCSPIPEMNDFWVGSFNESFKKMNYPNSSKSNQNQLK